MGRCHRFDAVEGHPYEPPDSPCLITLSDISFASRPSARVTGQGSAAWLTAVPRASHWKRRTFRPHSIGGGPEPRVSPRNAGSRTRPEFFLELCWTKTPAVR